MATQVKHRRGTNAEILAGVPAIGELWFNTTDNSIHMGNGASQGGVKQSRGDVVYSAVFKKDTYGSAIENMIAGRINGVQTLVHVEGNIYSTGGTTWEHLGSNIGSETIADFKPLGCVFVSDFGIDVSGVTNAQPALDSLFNSAQEGWKFLAGETDIFKLDSNLDVAGWRGVEFDGGNCTFDTTAIPVATPKRDKITFSDCSDGEVYNFNVTGNITPADITAGDDVTQVLVTQSCERFDMHHVKALPVDGGQLCHGFGFYANNSEMYRCESADGQEFGVICIRDRSKEGYTHIHHNKISRFNKNYEPAYDTSNVHMYKNVSIDPEDAHYNPWAKGSATATVENCSFRHNLCIGGKNLMYMAVGAGNDVLKMANIHVEHNVCIGLTDLAIASTMDVASSAISDIIIRHNNFIDFAGYGILSMSLSANVRPAIRNIDFSDNVVKALTNTTSVLVNIFAGTGTNADPIYESVKVNRNKFYNVGVDSAHSLIAFKYTGYYEFEGNEFYDRRTIPAGSEDIKLLDSLGIGSIKNNPGLEKITDNRAGAKYQNVEISGNPNIKTLDRGIATIPSGDALVYQSHNIDLEKLGLSSTDKFKVRITPNNSAAASSNWYIVNIFGTYFELRTTGNVSADAEYSYEIEF